MTEEDVCKLKHRRLLYVKRNKQAIIIKTLFYMIRMHRQTEISVMEWDIQKQIHMQVILCQMTDTVHLRLLDQNISPWANYKSQIFLVQNSDSYGVQDQNIRRFGGISSWTSERAQSSFSLLNEGTSPSKAKE